MEQYAIQTQSLTKIYGRGFCALNNVCLNIRKGDIFGLVGRNGAGTTGSLIMAETGLDIIRMKSGPLGGDQQIGSMIADGELDLVIFLRDPLTSQPHEPDVSALMRLCDVRNIPLATNKTSAAIMLKALSDGDIAEAEKDN